MTITWQRCKTYDEAKSQARVIYLHEWSGKPFYWGKAHTTFFGGHKRKLDGRFANPRYAFGYRHWIEGCLRHGAKLYIGKLDEEALRRVDDVENFLIRTYGTVMNMKKLPDNVVPLRIKHCGAVPASLRARP